MPATVCPVPSSQSAAGIQITGAPIGSTESSPAIPPSSNGRGTPASQRPKLVSSPCTIAVPRMP